MADTKVSAMTTISPTAPGDLVYIVDVSAGTSGSKKVTLSALRTALFAGGAGYGSDPLALAASSTAAAPVNIPHGTAPTSPVNGDLWTTTAGLYVRINGSTVGPLGTGGGAVSSVFSRTGAVVAQSGDYTFAQIGSKPTTLSGYGITDAAALAGATFTGAVITPASASGGAGLRLPHGSAPSSPTNGDLWTTTSGLFARINGSTVGPYLASVAASALTGSTLAAGVTASSLTSVGTLTALTVSGLLLTAASATGGAGLRLPHGSAPTSPTNGDLWTTSAGLYVRVNGATVGPLGTGGGSVSWQDEGSTILSAATVNFVGSGVALTDVGGVATVTVAGGSAPVSSVFGRTGAVVAVSGDYTFADIGSKPTTLSGYGITDAAALAGATFTGAVITAASASGGAGLRLPHGSAPSSPTNGDLWTTTAALFVRLNGVTQTVATLAGGTFTGAIITPATTTGAAGLNLPHGTAPTSPNNGDVWTTTAGIYVRINGATVGPLIAGLAGSALTGTSLASGIVSSSLTSVGTLSSLTLGGTLSMVDNELNRAYLSDYAEKVNALGNQSGSFNIDFTSGNVATVTLTGNATATITNPPATGRAGFMTIFVTGNGSATFAITGGVLASDQSAPAAITNTKVRAYYCQTLDAGTTWRYTYAGEW